MFSPFVRLCNHLRPFPSPIAWNMLRMTLIMGLETKIVIEVDLKENQHHFAC